MTGAITAGDHAAHARHYLDMRDALSARVTTMDLGEGMTYTAYGEGAVNAVGVITRGEAMGGWDPEHMGTIVLEGDLTVHLHAPRYDGHLIEICQPLLEILRQPELKP